MAIYQNKATRLNQLARMSGHEILSEAMQKSAVKAQELINMNKLSQAYNYHALPKAKPVSTECNYCNNTDDTCCAEADKNYEAEQAKRERELQVEDDLFNNELARLGFGAMVVGGE